MFVLYVLAAVVGVFLLVLYFRSIVVVALLNSKSSDIFERTARKTAVAIVQRFIADDASYEEAQRRQAWIMPLFTLFSVVTWFLLVQLAFTGILWGLRIEPEFWRALSASGSALSTLGYLTPSSLIGEYLAVFQAAIGLAVVMLLFTFVPGYQTSVQTRERKVGWLYARADHEANSERYLSWLLAKKHADAIGEGWEDWEHWFRGIRETHTLSPILSYVPSIYPGTSWLATSSAVLDAATAVTACLGPNTPSEVRICQREGTVTMRLIAASLGIGAPEMSEALSSAMLRRFDGLYDALVAAGLPVPADKAKCLEDYTAMRAEYAPWIRQVAAATLTPMKRLDLSDRDRGHHPKPAAEQGPRSAEPHH
ncbi:hypothetical protein [Kaistia adipata]|uniref:hypothetical protein n=1 Tax=Kaistia adipata TaxID=166954 RepID=UPI0003FE8C56|nr:hypothetical protein [Kaistia adipata]